jgi:hypothetical protein
VPPEKGGPRESPYPENNPYRTVKRVSPGISKPLFLAPGKGLEYKKPFDLLALEVA